MAIEATFDGSRPPNRQHVQLKGFTFNHSVKQRNNFLIHYILWSQRKSHKYCLEISFHPLIRSPFLHSFLPSSIHSFVFQQEIDHQRHISIRLSEEKLNLSAGQTWETFTFEQNLKWSTPSIIYTTGCTQSSILLRFFKLTETHPKLHSTQTPHSCLD